MPLPPLDATYAAIRSGVTWRLVPRDGVLVAGADAFTWLQGQVTQDLGPLAPPVVGPGEGFAAERYAESDAMGQILHTSRETLVLSPQGKVESYCRVTLLHDGEYLLDVQTGWGEALFERLRRFKLRVKATLESVEDLYAVELRGPETPLLTSLTPLGPLTPLDPLATVEVAWPPLRGVDVLVRGNARSIAAMAESVLGIGGGDDGAFEAARIEAGQPTLGAELTERTIPQEAGELASRTVSFTKGCYTGQELVARIDARGSNVPRRLHGVVIAGAPDSGPPPAADDEVRVGDSVVGLLTSVAYSPGASAYVALAYVKRGVEAPREAFVGADELPAVIRSLPMDER